MSGSGKLYLMALCGGADRPVGALRGRTPFQAAVTPHLDRLAADGRTGLLEVIAPGIPPESDSGAMALLGYDPAVHYTGRGPLEGFGNRYWDPEGHSVAFRINFASLNTATGRLDRRTSRDLSDEEMQELVAEILDRVRLEPGVEVRLTGWGRHRGILAFTSRNRPLSGEVSNTDPGFVKQGPFGVPVRGHDNRPLPARPLSDDPAAALTASLVNSFVAQSAKVLEASAVNARRAAAGRKAANLLLVRDGGHVLPDLPPAAARISMYGQVPAERGLARLIGASFTTAKVAPGQSEPAFYAELLPHLLADTAEVVFAHIKGPDEPGHDNQPEEKVRAIADLDACLIGPLRAALRPSDTLVVTCDHATPCEAGIHTDDKVPIAVAGPGIRPDAVRRFDEEAVSRGGLPIGRASELMPWLAKVRERS
ncbi:CMP-5'-phosphonoformate--3-phosphoglycerate phosphonoformyl transferase [Nonomuraea sp. NPDC050783]|uniref:CMP-5'-phosphonoformate--3-phosphoglycerate phosphonoformyl transferase n=1 Tax=Nonomuraea sp. NPDC050783 TaxID=3154634 RepID=UPI003467DBA0